MAAKNPKGTRFGTPTDTGAKNIKLQQLIDMKYLDEMVKSGFDESLWGREANKLIIKKPEQRGELLNDCERRL